MNVRSTRTPPEKAPRPPGGDAAQRSNRTPNAHDGATTVHARGDNHTRKDARQVKDRTRDNGRDHRKDASQRPSSTRGAAVKDPGTTRATSHTHTDRTRTRTKNTGSRKEHFFAGRGGLHGGGLPEARSGTQPRSVAKYILGLGGASTVGRL